MLDAPASIGPRLIARARLGNLNGLDDPTLGGALNFVAPLLHHRLKLVGRDGCELLRAGRQLLVDASLGERAQLRNRFRDGTGFRPASDIESEARLLCSNHFAK